MRITDLSKDIVLTGERSSLRQCFVVFGSGAATLNIRLAGRGARSEIKILLCGREQERADLDVRVMHEAPETYARVIIKAALLSEAHLTIRGMLALSAKANGSDSYLLAKALLLSPRAHAEIHPYLEIETDEVKASHGASVGRIDEQTMFYLRSRGVDEAQAQYIVLKGFFRDAVEELSEVDRKEFSECIVRGNAL